jgi:hypothetical protein
MAAKPIARPDPPGQPLNEPAKNMFHSIVPLEEAVRILLTTSSPSVSCHAVMESNQSPGFSFLEH